MDSLILFHCGIGMFGNLCAIYHLKLGAFATAKFIGWVLAQAYLGGKLEELSDTVDEQIENQLAETFQALGLVAMGPLAAVIGSAATRASQGFANAMLMYRLGRHAILILRPVRGS